MSYRLLIVEDSPEVLEAVCDFYTEKDGGLWDVTCSSDGNDALNKVSNEEFDLMILDIMLPGASGFDICKAARKVSNCPIIFLSALNSENNVLHGYETGCDDYIVKPFEMRYLYAKSLALLKRSKGDKLSDTLQCGRIKLDKRTMTVTVNEREIDIRSKEYFLLLFLLENKNATLSRKRILNEVWSNDLDVNDRVVDNTIRRLRVELGDASRQIKTVFGRGYKITEDNDG